MGREASYHCPSGPKNHRVWPPFSDAQAPTGLVSFGTLVPVAIEVCWRSGAFFRRREEQLDKRGMDKLAARRKVRTFGFIVSALELWL